MGWKHSISVTSCWTAVLIVLSLAAPISSSGQTKETLLFSNATTASGAAFGATLTWGSTWVDHNDDGDLDLFANRHWKRPNFYLWRGGEYVLSPYTFFSGSQRFFDRHSCAWGEANGDGRHDFFCDSGAQMGMGTGSNQLWIQTASGLSNRAKAYGVRDRYARSRTVNWLDYDSDGDLDIFTASKLRRGFPNRLFRNDRGTFTRVNAGLAREMNGLGSTWSDWDNDGDPDLLVLRYHPAAALAYENRGGVFAGVAIAGVTDRYWGSASWGDYDGDGWTDLQLVNHNRSVILHNNGGVFIRAHERRLARGASSTWIDVDNDGDLDSYVVQAREAGVNRPDFFLVNSSGAFTARFDPSFRGARAGSGESASVGDYNRDGRLDLFVTNGATIFEESLLEGPWTLLRNRSAGGNWARIFVRGADWNPWGFGGRLSVSADGLAYEREITDGVNFRSQSQVGQLVLGLGSAVSADVQLAWPEGGSDCVTVDARTSVEVTRGSNPC